MQLMWASRRSGEKTFHKRRIPPYTPPSHAERGWSLSGQGLSETPPARFRPAVPCAEVRSKAGVCDVAHLGRAPDFTTGCSGFESRHHTLGLSRPLRSGRSLKTRGSGPACGAGSSNARRIAAREGPRRRPFRAADAPDEGQGAPEAAKARAGTPGPATAPPGAPRPARRTSAGRRGQPAPGFFPRSRGPEFGRLNGGPNPRPGIRGAQPVVPEGPIAKEVRAYALREEGDETCEPL